MFRCKKCVWGTKISGSKYLCLFPGCVKEKNGRALGKQKVNSDGVNADT